MLLRHSAVMQKSRKTHQNQTLDKITLFCCGILVQNATMKYGDLPHHRCPDCRRRDHIEVQATVWFRLTPTGVDENGADEGRSYHQWDLASPALCGSCGYRGKLRDFHEEPGHPLDP